MDEYNAEEIELIQMLYIVLSDMPKLKVDNISNLTLNRDFVKVGEVKSKFNSKFIPMTINTNYFGKLLVDDTRLFYVNKINNQKKLLGKSDLSMNYVDSIYLYKDKFIIVNILNNSNIIRREIYSSGSGVLLQIVEDRRINKDLFVRKIGNVSFTISKDEVINMEAVKELSVIKYESKNTKDVSNPFIGSLDLETFEDLDGFAKVYALGFMILGKEAKMYYLKENQSNDELLLECFNYILSKYSGYIFYTHNFGKYDSVFIINILKTANLNKGFEYYKLETSSKDDKLLKLTIRMKDNKSSYKKITLIDSYNLLNDSLYNLSRSFDLNVTKSYFPHKFVKRNTLYYIGNTPSIDY
jgi:DNA polymerase type B, organellar and viral